MSLTMLTVNEQEYYVGGGSGTKEDPYTDVEYFRMLDSGTWSGGYVLFSNDVGNYVRNASGNWEFLPPGVRYAFSDVVVTAPKRNKYSGENGDPAGGTGSIPGSDDHVPSGVYPSDGNYGDDSQFSGNGGGTFQRGGGTSTPWDRSTAYLQKYGITLKRTGNSRDAETYLGQELDRLSKNNTFGSLMQELKELIQNYKIPVSIYAKSLGEKNGETLNSIPENKEIDVRIDIDFLNDSDNVGIGETIVHEMLHARNQAILRAYGIDLNQFLMNEEVKERDANLQRLKRDHPDIYGCYNDSKTPEVLKQADHELMAIRDRLLIVEILRETYPKLTQEECEALSWAGLHKTKAWGKLDEGTQGKILRVIYQYQRGDV